MNVYVGLSVISLLIILSFFFNLIQNRYNISSVILLLFTGILLHLSVRHLNHNLEVNPVTLKVLGILGMLVIVLEAVMDMKIDRSNYKVCLQAFNLSLLVLIFNLLFIITFFLLFYKMAMLQAVLYALPFSIVSSAIMIPSLSNMTGDVVSLLILESIFSDILGILVFNFASALSISPNFSYSEAILELFIMLLISVITTYFMGVILSKKKTKNLHVVILATLIVIYSISKLFHLSALVLILLFGLLLKNLPAIMSTKIGDKMLNKRLSQHRIESNLEDLKDFVEEVGFIVRSVFFVFLGYAIKIDVLLNIRVLFAGLVIVLIIYLVRFLLLKIFVTVKDRVFATAIAPRGLVTVLLLFQLSGNVVSTIFDEGVVFFVIVVTCIVMTYNLIANQKKYG